MNLLAKRIATGRKVIGMTFFFLSFAAVSYGQNVTTENLLKSWEGIASGPAEEINVINSVSQTVILDQTEIKTIFFSAESKAESVSGNSDVYYSIYINLIYTDGSKKDGVNCIFKTGTHDWEKSKNSYTPDKPIKSLKYYLLFRKHPGSAWFRNAVLTASKQ